MRDHNPVVIEEFNGLWVRGDPETVPLDHFSQAINVQYIESGFRTRDGIEPYQTATAIGNVVRIYNYVLPTGDSILTLDSNGDIYHTISPTVTYGPILSIPAMTDFGFIAVAGRAYITPYNSTINSIGQSAEIGLEDEFLYVYRGDGVAARKAGGAPSVSATPLVAVPGVAGFSDLGFHIFAIVFETNTGYLTAPGPLTFATATSVSEVQGYTISSIPVSPDTFVTKRHIVASKKVLGYNGDQDGYQLFFVPDGNIDDNTTTSKVISFYDIDLLEDASHLIDNFSEIPAGVALATYNGRMILTTEFDNISLVRVSAPGEPEAFDQVDGLIIIPLDGNPVTNAQEFRDVLYIYKKTRTYACVDNEDIPSTWIPEPVDQGIGAPVHGISQVLDSGGVNVEYLVIADFSGIMLFNGAYTRPELSWKIATFWLEIDHFEFRKIQMVNDTINQIIYLTLPDSSILSGDYSNGINPKAIKWAIWNFDIEATTIALINVNRLIIGSLQES